MTWKRLLLTLVVVLGLSAGLLIGQSSAATGASLSATSSASSVQAGQTFTVTISAYANQAVNSASGTVTYSSNVQATSVSISGSVFQFWTQTPAVGTSIAFGGGLATPGLVGSGKIFSITFKANATGTAKIAIGGGQTLANDGSGTNIYTGPVNASVSVVAAPVSVTPLVISSTSQPSQSTWYKSTSGSVLWNKPSNLTSFSYQMIAPSGAISQSASTTATTYSFSNLTDGVWTFKLTGAPTTNNQTASFTIRIDTAPPSAFKVAIVQADATDPFPIVNYAASDGLSGIDHYLVSVDGGTSSSTTQTSTKLARQLPGSHTVSVQAFDKAGNSLTETTSFTVRGFPGPVLTAYPKYVSILEPVQLTGNALYGDTVQLYVDGKQVTSFTVSQDLSDHQRQISDPNSLVNTQTVQWIYYYKGTLKPGVHKFFATQTNPDTSVSDPSNTVSTQVLWSSVTLYGFTAPLALVALGLLVLLVLAIILILWLWLHSVRAVGNWSSRLRKTRAKVDSDLSALEKSVESSAPTLDENPELKKQLESQISKYSQKIDKDLESVVKDAEKGEKDK